MAQEKSNVKEQTNTRLQKPRKYKVIFLNDDFTTFDFVVAVLITVFNKEEEEAVQLTMDVDEKGMAVVGTYSYDMAKTKTERAQAIARTAGFPLEIIFEPA